RSSDLQLRRRSHGAVGGRGLTFQMSMGEHRRGGEQRAEQGGSGQGFLEQHRGYLRGRFEEVHSLAARSRYTKFRFPLSPRRRADASLDPCCCQGALMGNHKIEIRRSNVEKILLGAEKVFAEKGFGSTAMADIAAEVQLPRSNLHYYVSTKRELYRAVLWGLLEVWKQDSLCFEMFADPRVVHSSYIRAKMNHSRSRPYG